MGFLISLDKLTLWIFFRKFSAEIMGYDFSLSLFFKTFLTLFFRVFFVVGFICSIFVHVKKFSGFCLESALPRNEPKQSPVRKYEAPSSPPGASCLLTLPQK